jgi:adenine-specific DNA-methyltransferase
MIDSSISSYDADCMKVIDPKHRKEFGQYATPYNIAQFMVNIAAYKKEALSVLDPSVGCGIFPDLFLELMLKGPTDKANKITGFDIDNQMVNITKMRLTKKNISKCTLSLHNEDFLLSDISQEFNIVICNPPYVKSNRIKIKDTYLKNLKSKYGYTLSGKNGLDGFFLLKSIRLLNENGTFVFITPAEFLNSGYGFDIKRYLLKDMKLNAFIYLDIDSFVFEDGMSSALIIVATKSRIIEDNHKVKFFKLTQLDSITKINPDLSVNGSLEDISVREYLQRDLDPNEKWLPKFSPSSLDVVDKTNYIKLGEIFNVHRGIATGANKFFTLSRTEVQEWGIPEKYLLPIITKAPYASPPTFTEKDFVKLIEEGKKTFLLNINEMMPKSIEKYLQYGVSLRIHKTYLNSKRKKWFFVEQRNTPQLFAKVFQRNGLEFIWNKAGIKNLTCFHGLYPKFSDIRIAKALILYSLTSKGKATIEEQSRKYAGGLNKLEPRDVEKILIPDFTKFSESELEQISLFFDKHESEGYIKLKKETNKAFDHLFARKVINENEKKTSVINSQ